MNKHSYEIKIHTLYYLFKDTLLLVLNQRATITLDYGSHYYIKNLTPTIHCSCPLFR